MEEPILQATDDGGALPDLLAAVVEALPDPVLIVDRNLRIVAANGLSARLSALVRQGGALQLAVRSPDILEAAARVLSSGKAEKITWHARVPVEQVHDVHVSPLQIGSLRHIAIILHDVTEVLRVERMRVDFIANASHELRTPLASLLGFVETLQGAARDDAKARVSFLEIMRNQGRRMARLLDDLLQLSRIEQNEHLQPRDQVNLADIVGHVIDTLSPMAQAAGVELVVNLPRTLLITGARDELIRVAENLIENAIKYGGETKNTPARVDIALTVEGSEAILTVRDYGPGIAREHLPRLTERFYRADAPASRAKGGTGLGLAIVKHIVARHRGSLSISSTEGEGAEFRVTLPASGT